MALTKAQKTELFETLDKAFDSSKSVVFVKFHGLPVLEGTKVRRSLRSQGVSYVVAKKTIAKKALEKHGYQGTMPSLDGELALAYSEDMIAPAREIYKFEKELDKKVYIMGGIFEGKYQNREEMMNIATIPGREALLGMFLNVINSPIQGFAVALNAIAEKKQA